jgi:FMN-dependent NADH-azoreductase
MMCDFPTEPGVLVEIPQEALLKLLHVIATPRAHDSNTMRPAVAFLESMHAKYADLSVDTLNLFSVDLPAVAGENIETKYTLMLGQPIDKRHQESWGQIERLIKHFLSSDIYLISTPMWNFSIPYALKYYIDSIVQPGYLFKYNEQKQPVGLVHGKTMICVTSRGGDYSEQSPFHAYDFQESYLRAIFGFVGITDIHFINAQPMDVTPQLREVAIAAAVEEARSLAINTEWGAIKAVAATVHPAELKPEPLQ